MFGIVRVPESVIYDRQERFYVDEQGRQSAISDMALYGGAVKILEEGEWLYVVNHYGYFGYMDPGHVMKISEEELKEYLAGPQMICVARNADILAAPRVQGDHIISLPAGAVVTLCDEACDKEGWTAVVLADGTKGYTPTKFLGQKKYSEDYLFKDTAEVKAFFDAAHPNKKTAKGGVEGFDFKAFLADNFKGDENAFRASLVEVARTYMGVQYRWGGRSSYGIDCSGLVSTAYMRNGILLFRDAAIADGYGLVRIDVDWTEDGHFDTANVDNGKIRVGDALFFPGHVAMYIGNGRFIHSTAHAGSNGVVINSLIPGDEDYREDLLNSLYAVGGLR